MNSEGLGGLHGLRRRLGVLRHYLGAQLGVGCQDAMFAQRGSAHFAQRSYADTKRIRCSRGRGTSAASRCMNSSGDITKWVVPSRLGVLSLSTPCPAALVCTRSLASAGRVMWQHSCSSAWRSSPAQRTAACKLKPSMSAHRCCLKSASLGIAPSSVITFWPARVPKAIRYVQAAACNGLSTRASSESPSLSAM